MKIVSPQGFGRAISGLRRAFRLSCLAVGAFATLSVGALEPLTTMTGSSASLSFTGEALAQRAPRPRAPVHRPRPPVHHHRPRPPVHRPPARVHHHHRRHVHRRPVVVYAPIRPVPSVRPWFWGSVVAGVTVGAIIASSSPGVVPTAPSQDLCWYWTDSSRTRGYWSYCVAPTR